MRSARIILRRMPPKPAHEDARKTNLLRGAKADVLALRRPLVRERPISDLVLGGGALVLLVLRRVLGGGARAGIGIRALNSAHSRKQERTSRLKCERQVLDHRQDFCVLCNARVEAVRRERRHGCSVSLVGRDGADARDVLQLGSVVNARTRYFFLSRATRLLLIRDFKRVSPAAQRCVDRIVECVFVAIFLRLGVAKRIASRSRPSEKSAELGLHLRRWLLRLRHAAGSCAVRDSAKFVGIL